MFSGIGGFEIGIQNVIGKENMEIVFTSEIDKYASRAYELYFNHKPRGDITKINEKDIPDHDILTAGFPCQAFSVAGQRKGFEDTRGTLFFEIARVLKEKQPREFNEYSPTIRTAKGGGHIPSVCTSDDNKVEKEINGFRIRKLTPRECWRLQGFPDGYHDLVAEEISNTQRYKQAGNAVSTNVVSEIFKQILKYLHKQN